MSFDLPFELPNGWELKTVEQLVNEKIIEKPLDGNHGGIHPKSSDYVEEGIPFVMASDLEAGRVDFHGCKFITEQQANTLRKGFSRAGDVLISHKATIGRTAIVQESNYPFIMLTPQVTYYRVTDEERLSNIYLKAYFDSHFFQSLLALWAGAGSTRAYLGITGQLKLPVILPPIDMQIFIANHAFALDKKIEINRQTNQTLEQIAQAIFKSWFVDFDPVKAKIAVLEAGGTAEQAELAAMSAISAKDETALKQLQAEQPEAYAELVQTAALFPSKMVDSELGEIPEGWEVKPLGNFLDVLETGSRPKGGVGGIKEGVPSVGAENIIGVGNYAYGKEKFVSREFFDKLKRGVIQDFDFLLYKDGGKPGEFKPRVSMFGCGFPYSEFAINEHVFRMRSEFLGQAFLYLQISHRRVLDELANRGGKAAIPGINQTDVKTIPIVVPSNNEVLKHFNSITIKLIEGILKRAAENNQLAQVRDALLPKLLSGELPIPETDETTA